MFAYKKADPASPHFISVDSKTAAFILQSRTPECCAWKRLLSSYKKKVQDMWRSPFPAVKLPQESLWPTSQTAGLSWSLLQALQEQT